MKPARVIIRIHAYLSLWVFLALTPLAAQSIHVSISSPRPEPGQTEDFSFEAPASHQASAGNLKAEIMVPLKGMRPLTLKPQGGGKLKAEFTVESSAPQGLYSVYAWVGNGSTHLETGNATFVVGKVIADFFEPVALNRSNPAEDIEGYLQDFHGLGGNLLIAHSIITPGQAYFPCATCKDSPAPGSPGDVIEALLKQTDSRGIGVLLSVGWDMTHQSPYQERWAQTQSIMKELYRLYRKHPSFLGFYAYQEGSGTYYVPYVRKFAHFAKSIDAGLLTACAPYADNPLLAGYLGDIPDLDIIMYQAMVMASYRPDNRKEYPLRRIHDFCSLSTGAKKLQHKIALTHVELFGYLENDIGNSFTSYQNQYGQFLSAATVADNDGIAMFAYHPLIYTRLKSYPEAEESRRAVVDGLRAYRFISPMALKPSLLAAYFPYSDWIAERWSQSYLPALDAFRSLGIPLDVLPYSPPFDESLLPYYPMDANTDVLSRLLREKTVLVLPNVSGFQKTDSDLIEEFVRRGGAIIAFGPQIPMGVSYQRSKVFGVEEMPLTSHDALVVRSESGNRVPPETSRKFTPVRVPSWRSTTATVIASYEDGSAAVTINRFGKGIAAIISADAATAAKNYPELVRDIIDLVMKSVGEGRSVDILGADDNIDAAISTTPNGFRVAIVNHNQAPVNITLKPLNSFSERRAEWIDVGKDKKKPISSDRLLTLVIPGDSFRAIEWRTGDHSPTATDSHLSHNTQSGSVR